ncbi:MAG: hypothetical protein VXZ38_04505 [Planctomycetota bacterium]|nr:hypothetical protein [Planctomycetota bacterium]
MTLLGKSFSVVILILSAIFMVLALAVNASHRNWRDVVLTGINGQPGLKSQIESITRENDQLRDSKDRIQADLNREQAARRTALAALQTQLDQLQGVLQSSEAKVQQQTAQITVLTQTDLSRAEELERLTAENVTLRSQIRTEQQDRDTLFTETLTLTDQMNTLRGFKQELEVRNQQLIAQATRYKEVMTSKGIDVNEPLDGAPPDRNGNILQIDRPSSLVLVSIGYDEGLRKGHFLEVTRDGRYMGKLKVRNTEPDRSVAEILDDYSEGILQEGDRVDTTIE